MKQLEVRKKQAEMEAAMHALKIKEDEACVSEMVPRQYQKSKDKAIIIDADLKENLVKIREGLFADDSGKRASQAKMH